MSIKESSGYTYIGVKPERHDTYLVKTEQGCYDFAFYSGDGEHRGWEKGAITSGYPEYWMEIPQHN